MAREAQHQGQSPPTRYAQHLPARRASLIRKTVADSIAYRRVPKTYLSVQDRELLSAPTKRPARNGHYSNNLKVPSVLTRACAWHGVHTPAHQVSKNRPRKSCSQMTILFYIRVDSTMYIQRVIILLCSCAAISNATSYMYTYTCTTYDMHTQLRSMFLLEMIYDI